MCCIKGMSREGGGGRVLVSGNGGTSLIVGTGSASIFCNFDWLCAFDSKPDTSTAEERRAMFCSVFLLNISSLSVERKESIKINMITSVLKKIYSEKKPRSNVFLYVYIYYSDKRKLLSIYSNQVCLKNYQCTPDLFWKLPRLPHSNYNII